MGGGGSVFAAGGGADGFKPGAPAGAGFCIPGAAGGFGGTGVGGFDPVGGGGGGTAAEVVAERPRAAVRPMLARRRVDTVFIFLKRDQGCRSRPQSTSCE